MKKLHSLAFYALATPLITLSSASLLAQPPTGQDADRQQQSAQRDQDATQRTPGAAQSTPRAGQPGSQAAASQRSTEMQHRGYIGSAPANSLQASDLIGADVKTIGNEDVGSVDDLIVDGNGQIVAIVVGVGGFLGLGEKRVAIGWDDVKMSGSSDEMELRIEATREALSSAPEFEEQD